MAGADRLVRERAVGNTAVRAALAASGSERPVRIVLCDEQRADEADLRTILDDASARSIETRMLSPTQLARLSGAGAEGASPGVMAMLGPDPSASLETMLAAGGAAWLLCGTAYPGNAGFAIRTAELSGADGIVIDAPFTHAQRRDARRAAMRADRFLPVHYAPAEEAVLVARAKGKRIVAIEDSGTRTPWESDLLPPSLFLVGGERRGVDEALLATADLVLRLPMPGFMPSYNLQAAMAGVAFERLRQWEAAMHEEPEKDRRSAAKRLSS